MNAKEAKDKTNIKNTDMTEIYSYINQSIGNGSYEVTLAQKLLNVHKLEKLKSLGYKITRTPGLDYKIDWSE